MTQTIVSVIAFLVLLALLPLGIRWAQRRSLAGSYSAASASRILSALAVGPHQRVVTIEIGPEGDKTCLVLGVTAQNITCLYSLPMKKSLGKEQNPPAAAIDNPQP
jgi:flagellar protein FliO/FliZ